MINKIFGPAWAGTPAEQDTPGTETPIGEQCLWCDERFVEGDSGMLMMSVNEEGIARRRGLHHACHLRQLLGSVGCQKGHRPGECPGDDPSLSKREAAEAAMAFFRQNGMPGSLR